MSSILQSPGILATQRDGSFYVPNVTTSVGGIGGVMRWGPLDKLMLVDSEQTLAQTYLGPTNLNAETWFVARNFLTYTNALYFSRAGDWTGNTVVRSVTANSTNPVASAGSNQLMVGNTTNLSVGMVLFSSNASAVLDSLSTLATPRITSIVNSTAITISENASANVVSAQFVFREDVVYASVAQEVNDPTIDWDGQLVRNEEQYVNVDGLFDTSVLYVARFGGFAGDSLRVDQCDSPSQFSSNVNLIANTTAIDPLQTSVKATVGSNVVTVTVAPVQTSNASLVSAANTLIGQVAASIAVNDLVQTGNSTMGFQFLKVDSISAVQSTANVFSFTLNTEQKYNLGANSSDTTFTRFWEFYNYFDRAPGVSASQIAQGNSSVVDEMHVVVVDEDGKFSGSPGTVLENFKAVSRATDAKNVDGGTNYYKSVINQGSKYVWVANPRSTARSNTAQFLPQSTGTAPLSMSLFGGGDGLDESTVPLASLTFAYDKFGSSEDVPDVSLVMQGKARGQNVSYNTQLGNYILDNIASVRGDLMATVTPDKSLTVNNVNNEASGMVAARQVMSYSSYGILDSGYKYQYDRYNDVYRWVPLNGDIAGLCARTDLTNDAWWAPGGYSRGLIKDVTRLAFNPRQAYRDLLYKNDINPVITQAGAGTLLFGNKTMYGQDSLFSRINVQRLFIVLKKAISLSARAQLFGFNDDQTRSAFRNSVTPFLKNIQGRRGIEDFIVVCDTTNNGPEVRIKNEFRATIGVKPANAIDFIYLSFVAVRNDVSVAQGLAGI